jgi:hypothetical protein
MKTTDSTKRLVTTCNNALGHNPEYQNFTFTAVKTSNLIKLNAKIQINFNTEKNTFLSTENNSCSQVATSLHCKSLHDISQRMYIPLFIDV